MDTARVARFDALTPAVVVGVGEMGGVFARALLRTGHPVVPVLRASDRAAISTAVPAPLITLVTVAEGELEEALDGLPTPWRSSVGLVQNEILPRTWERHGLTDPTVAVVWFEKKPGQDVKVIIPTPVAGPGAELLVSGLDALGIPAEVVGHGEQLLFHLVAKNLYILTANIAGLEVGGTVGELWRAHRKLATAVAGEVLAIQEWLCGADLDRSALIAAMVTAFEADPEHKTTGRSAPGRLARALSHAAEAAIATPRLDAIAQRHGVSA